MTHSTAADNNTTREKDSMEWHCTEINEATALKNLEEEWKEICKLRREYLWNIPEEKEK